jgi:hypothetical protein
MDDTVMVINRGHGIAIRRLMMSSAMLSPSRNSPLDKTLAATILSRRHPQTSCGGVDIHILGIGTVRSAYKQCSAEDTFQTSADHRLEEMVLCCGTARM